MNRKAQEMFIAFTFVFFGLFVLSVLGLFYYFDAVSETNINKAYSKLSCNEESKNIFFNECISQRAYDVERCHTMVSEYNNAWCSE